MEELKLEEIKAVKALGFLHNRGTRCFNGRIITENGVITSEQLDTIAQASKKFGSGTVSFTVRLTLEVPGIAYENIEPFREFIATAGLKTGGTGNKVRPIVACKGTTCVFGLCDTQGIATQIHKRFFEGYNSVALPHKFKITVGGCPNNCAKPDLNDIGIVGQRVIEYDLASCKGCKKCGIEKVCPMKAASVVDGKLRIDSSLCNYCGRCLKDCYFNVPVAHKDMFKVYLGGRWGKKIRMGSVVSELFTMEEILDFVEKTILFFKAYGIAGERFGQTIDRIGMENVEKILLSNELLEKKEEIIKG